MSSSQSRENYSLSDDSPQPVIDVRTKGDNPMKTLKNVLEKISFKPEGFTSTNINLLVVGRTGKGKSTFINSIIELEKQIAEESQGSICTTEVQCYVCRDVIPGFNVTLIDTPGLQDVRKLEYQCLQRIKEQCPEVSLVLYCVDMNIQRPENDALEAMRKLNQSFGLDFWKRVVFILTRANKVDCEEICEDMDLPDDGDDETLKKQVFLDMLQSCTNKIQSTLKHVLDKSDHKLVGEIPMISVGRYKRKRQQSDHLQLPCTDNWLLDVLTLCCDQIAVKHMYSKLTLNNKIHFAIIIDNEFIQTEEIDIVELNDCGEQAEATRQDDEVAKGAKPIKESEELKKVKISKEVKETKEALEKLGFCVLYFNKLNSFGITQLLSAFKSAANNSRLAAFTLVILSKGGSRHIYGSDEVPVPFEQIFSCCIAEEKQLLSIPKLFFFFCPILPGDKDSELSSDFKIPDNSIVLAVSPKQPNAKDEHVISPAVANFIDGLNVNNCRIKSLQQCFQEIKTKCSDRFYCVYDQKLPENIFLPVSYQSPDSSKLKKFREKKLSLCRSIWYDVRNQTIKTLDENKEEVIKIVQREKVAKVSSSAVSVIGVGMVAAGVFLTPVTGGASLALVVGSTLSGVSAVTGVAAHIVGHIKSNSRLKKAQEQIDMDRQLSIILSNLAAEYQKAVEANRSQMYVGGIRAVNGGFGVVVKLGLSTARVAGKVISSALVVITIPLDVYFLICNLSSSITDHQMIQSFTKLTEGSLKGFFTPVEQKTTRFNEGSVVDDGCGYRILLQHTLFTDDVSYVTIEVNTILSGPFKLPEGTILVSAVYDISVVESQLKKRFMATIKPDHCVEVDDDAVKDKLTFAVGTVNLSKKIFEFVPKKGGKFSIGEQRGSIDISENCLLCILYCDSESLKVKYLAQHSYSKDGSNVTYLFTKKLDAHVKYAKKHGEFEKNEFKLTAPVIANCKPSIELKRFCTPILTDGNWKISLSQDRDNTDQIDILKTTIDNLELCDPKKLLWEIIPSLELDVMHTAESNNDGMTCIIEIGGTNLKLEISAKK